MFRDIRDDLHDGGAEHFARTIQAIRAAAQEHDHERLALVAIAGEEGLGAHGFQNGIKFPEASPVGARAPHKLVNCFVSRFHRIALR